MATDHVGPTNRELPPSKITLIGNFISSKITLIVNFLSSKIMLIVNFLSSKINFLSSTRCINNKSYSHLKLFRRRIGDEQFLVDYCNATTQITTYIYK